MSDAAISAGTPRRRTRAGRLKGRAATSAVVTLIMGALVVLWQVAAGQAWINGQLFGSPLGIYKAADVGLTQGNLVADTLTTLYETVLGLVIGSGLGIGLGLLLWFVPRVAGVTEGFAVVLNSIPKIALGPLIVIWFGSDMTSKVWLAGISTFAAAREVDRDLLNLFLSFKAKPGMIFRKLIVPGALPWIFSTLRINIGFALIGAVVGEYIASQSGLGHEVFVAGSLFDLNTVWLGIIILTLMATLLTKIVQFAESQIISWKTKR
jgi:NitT/TauT family transport system permease protein